MSKWADAVETVLAQFEEKTEIPFAFERWKIDESQPLAEQLPDRFLVYFFVDDVGETYADGKETSHQPRIQVSFFYRSKEDFLTVPDEIVSAFTAAGFTRSNNCGRIPYQSDTGHYGWHQDFYYYERR